MGCCQVEQPVVGKEGILPAVMIPSTTATWATGAVAQDRTQAHSQPRIDARERPFVSVFEVCKPPTGKDDCPSELRHSLAGSLPIQGQIEFTFVTDYSFSWV